MFKSTGDSSWLQSKFSQGHPPSHCSMHGHSSKLSIQWVRNFHTMSERQKNLLLSCISFGTVLMTSDVEIATTLNTGIETFLRQNLTCLVLKLVIWLITTTPYVRFITRATTFSDCSNLQTCKENF